MSYRDYKIIDDKSGLIVPQALIATGEKISAAFGAELARQHKETQLLNKEIAQKGYKINEDTQDRIDKLDEKAMEGSEKLVNSFKETQRKLTRKSGDLATEIMELEMRGGSLKKINKLKEERSKVQNSIGGMNTSFVKMGVIGTETTALQTAGNSKLGNTEIYTNSDQMVDAQAITGAPGTSAIYELDENYNPVISITGEKTNWRVASGIEFGAISPLDALAGEFKGTESMNTPSLTGKASGFALYQAKEGLNAKKESLGTKEKFDKAIPKPKISGFKKGKSPYKNTMSLGAFNDSRYSPISKIVDTKSAAIAKTTEIVGGGSGKIGKTFLENETFVIEDKVVNGVNKGKGERGIQLATQDGQAALNTALEDIMTQIESTKGMPNQTQIVLKNKYAVNNERIEAYGDINNPGHDEAVDYVRFAVAKQVGAEYGLETKINPVSGGANTYEFYKKNSFKEDTLPNAYAKENNIELARLKSRLDKFAPGQGPITGANLDKALTQAFNVGSGMQIKKVGTASVVQVKSARIEGNKLILNYKGIPTRGETSSMGNVDEMVLDLDSGSQLYNAIDAMTALNPSNTQALADYIVALRNRS